MVLLALLQIAVPREPVHTCTWLPFACTVPWCVAWPHVQVVGPSTLPSCASGSASSWTAWRWVLQRPRRVCERPRIRTTLPTPPPTLWWPLTVPSSLWTMWVGVGVVLSVSCPAALVRLVCACGSAVVVAVAGILIAGYKPHIHECVCPCESRFRVLGLT
jgi:hypothetical protein